MYKPNHFAVHKKHCKSPILQLKKNTIANKISSRASQHNIQHCPGLKKPKSYQLAEEFQAE